MDLVEVAKRNNPSTARHPWELARFEVVNNLLTGIIKNEEGFNVLDIGCGDIFFISKLSELYPKANFYAIDIAFTNEIIETLKVHTKGKNIFLFKSLEEAEQHMIQPANLILLLDVVEHIEDDNRFLSSLHANKKVTKDTTIMITVPAFQSLFCSHDDFLGHYRRYTNRSLKMTVEKAGFVSKDLGYFFSSLIPPRIIQVLKEKVSKPKTGSETTGLVQWDKGEGVTNIIKNILLFDFKFHRTLKKISGLSLAGLSNYIICKKAA